MMEALEYVSIESYAG